MGSMKLVCAIVLCMVVVAPMASEATFSCNQVGGNLAPCLVYLRNGGAPSVGCCNGVRALNSAAKTTPDRQAACECLKGAARSITGINPVNAGNLPGRCGVNIPYKISTSTNCKTVK